MATSGRTVYFENGGVVDVSPWPYLSYYEHREEINDAVSIVSDGVRYRLDDRDSILSIAVPKFPEIHPGRIMEELGVTGNLDYVLRMHAGGLWNHYEYDLSVCCLAKATQMMVHSNIGWRAKDFFRIVHYLLDLGCEEKANEWYVWIKSNARCFNSCVQEDHFARVLESCKILRTDLVEVSNSTICCHECAKYRNRIYSLTGKDKRFPKFPSDFHFQCPLGIYPFVYGESKPAFECKNLILYCRRPYADTRTPHEEEIYQTFREEIDAEENPSTIPDVGRVIYTWYKPLFEDSFPKTMSGFLRGRRANSKNYRNLIAEIKEAGYIVPQSTDEIKDIISSGEFLRR